MLRKYTLLLLLLTCFTFSLFAQVEHRHTDRCGHTLLMNVMDSQFPGYKEAAGNTFRAVKEKVPSQRVDMVYTIPVVVHVVWKEAEENIDDQLIYDQIEALNEDFRALNSDYANLRPDFEGLASDPMIEFELVHIQRVETTNTFGIDLFEGFDDDLLKETANGGSDPWPTEDYLNIWVCNIQPIELFGMPLGQILGYSYPPVNISDYPDLNNWPSEALEAFSDPALDGVVVHYPTFGGRGRSVNIELMGELAMEGRTLVHEIGHYLGLRHIWGDPDPLSGQDGCTVDDGIADTPNAADNSQVTGCVPSKNTCTDTGDDLPDMWENYMDYSEEFCQVAFSAGQIAIMRGVLEGPRASLIDGSTVSSTEPSFLQKYVNVFPNPASEIIYLEVDPEITGSFSFFLTDVMGRQITPVQQKQTSAKHSIDVSGFANGLYFLKIAYNEEHLVKKIILNNFH